MINFHFLKDNVIKPLLQSEPSSMFYQDVLTVEEELNTGLLCNIREVEIMLLHYVKVGLALVLPRGVESYTSPR